MLIAEFSLLDASFAPFSILIDTKSFASTWGWSILLLLTLLPLPTTKCLSSPCASLFLMLIAVIALV